MAATPVQIRTLAQGAEMCPVFICVLPLTYVCGFFMQKRR